MSQTASTLTSILYERWTDTELQKQYLDDDSFVAQFQGIKATMIGRQAQTPIWGDLNSGGFTVTSSAGGAINTASNQGSNQAVWTLTQQIFPIGVEFSALNQSDDGVLSVISGKNQEIRGALSTLNRQAARQLGTNADGKVAACDTTSSSNTVALIASPSGTAYGYDAIVRGWLRPGAVVDIGTTSDTDAIATAVTVTGVAESSSAPTITISGSTVSTTNGTHFVYIANPNSTTAANPEANGLRNMIASSGALGSLNPATAGQEFWQAALRDTSTTVLSLDLLLNMSRSVKQKSNSAHSDTWMGLKQQMNLYALLQNQVRYAGDLNLNAGNVNSVAWGGTTFTAFPDILDSDVFCVTKSDLLRVTGKFTTPKWMTQVYGNTEQFQWHAGNTDGQDAIVFAWQTGLRRRNTHAAATGLTA